MEVWPKAMVPTLYPPSSNGKRVSLGGKLSGAALVAPPEATSAVFVTYAVRLVGKSSWKITLLAVAKPTLTMSTKYSIVSPESA